MMKILPSKRAFDFSRRLITTIVISGMASLTSFADPALYEYRTRTSGGWEQVNTWEFRARNTSASWSILTDVNDIPNDKAGTIIITGGQEVEIGDARTADELIIEPGASLYVWDKLIIPDNPNFGVEVNGELNIIGELHLNDQVVFGSGSFTLSQDGILGIGSPDGITTHASGNIQVQNKTFNIGATYIYNGISAQVTGNGLPANSHIVINNPSGVTLNQSVNAASLSLLAGKLVTETSKLLTLNNGATVSTTPNSFVEGPLARKISSVGIQRFPVGKGINARPLELNIVSTAGENTYVVEQFDTEYIPQTSVLPSTVTHISKVRYFSIQKIGNEAVTANLKLSYGTDDGVTDPSTITIVKYHNGLAEDLSVTQRGDGFITSDDFTTFSEFVLANKTGGNNPLPVELLSFSAKAGANAIGLSWETASEQNSKHFEIERSADARNFETLGWVEAAGNSQTLKRYAFEDKNPLSGLAYYRLKQVDLDGKTAYSKIEIVNLPSGGATVSVYPNPTSGLITISLPQSEEAEIKVVNVLGQQVLIKRYVQANSLVLDLKLLPAGTYQILITTNKQQLVKKVVKAAF